MYDKKTDALKLFLAEFRNGASAKWTNDREYYKTKIYSYYLGDLDKTIISFAKDGLLRPMTPAEVLEMDFKVQDLKEECKKRGLKISGKKTELIERLLTVDQDLLKSCDKRDDMWICTVLGLSIVEAFYAEQAQQEKDLQTLVFALLAERKYREAANAVEQIRNRRIFPDWMASNFTSEISLASEEKEVEIIWEEIPKALSKLKESFLNKARYWISWDILRGTNHILEFEKEPTNVEGLSLGQTMQTLMIYASGKLQLANWQKMRMIKGVRIEEMKENTKLCPECQKLTGKVYNMKRIPVIPNEKCRNAAPCPLCYIPDSDGTKKGLFGLFG